MKRKTKRVIDRKGQKKARKPRLKAYLVTRGFRFDYPERGYRSAGDVVFYSSDEAVNLEYFARAPWLDEPEAT